ncbi:MAG: DUF1269 domain-containing protein [Chloroflexi bacterium]|nr:MAG: DUF1269 domain-containing protein [Chloroflexota bacterium]
MTLGPLEYILIGFEGNRFTGQILPELRAARDKGIIRVIDLLLILKDEQGNTAVMELSDLSSEELEQLGPIAGDLLEVLEQDDVEAIASNIPNNSSAALLLIEQTWAVGLKKAIMDAGGIPLAGGLVAPAVVQMLEAELAAEAAKQNQAEVKAAE